MSPNLPEIPAKLKSSTPQSEAAVTVLPPAAVTPWLFAQLSSAYAKSYLVRLQEWQWWVGCLCCLHVCALSSTWLKRLQVEGREGTLFFASLLRLYLISSILIILRSKYANIWLPLQSRLILCPLPLLHNLLLWVLFTTFVLGGTQVVLHLSEVRKQHYLCPGAMSECV